MPCGPNSLLLLRRAEPDDILSQATIGAKARIGVPFTR